MNAGPGDRIAFAEEVFRIQGAIFEVNRRMGAGFLEAVYQECLEIELPNGKFHSSRCKRSL